MMKRDELQENRLQENRLRNEENEELKNKRSEIWKMRLRLNCSGCLVLLGFAIGLCLVLLLCLGCTKTKTEVSLDNSFPSCYIEVYDSRGYGFSLPIRNFTYENYSDCWRLQEMCEKQQKYYAMGEGSPIEYWHNLNCSWEMTVCSCQIVL